MKYIRTLFVCDESDSVQTVFLLNEDTNQVLHENVGSFYCRMSRPHNRLFEIRQISRHDSRVALYLRGLSQISSDAVSADPKHVEAFRETFLVASGFYHSTPLTAFDDINPLDPKEQIAEAACVFLCYFEGASHYQEVMLTGDRHADCLELAFKLGLQYSKPDTKQGFWTSFGRFIDRYEAKQLALKNGQLKEDTGMAALYSEDLW